MKLFEAFPEFEDQPVVNFKHEARKLSGLLRRMEDQLNKFHKEYLDTYHDILDWAYQETARNNPNHISKKLITWSYKGDVTKTQTEELYALPKDAQRFAEMQQASDQVKEKIKRVKQMRIRQEQAYQKRVETATIELIDNAPVGQIDPSDVPKKIETGSGSWIKNPYFSSDVRYAGHPIHCPFWTKQSKTMYFDISFLLDDMGIPGFTTMYASGEPGLEFVIIGANGRLIWRKFGLGASGQNWIYVDGAKYNTSMLFGAYYGPNGPGTETARSILDPLRS